MPCQMSRCPWSQYLPCCGQGTAATSSRSGSRHTRAAAAWSTPIAIPDINLVYPWPFALAIMRSRAIRTAGRSTGSIWRCPVKQAVFATAGAASRWIFCAIMRILINQFFCERVVRLPSRCFFRNRFRVGPPLQRILLWLRTIYRRRRGLRQTRDFRPRIAALLTAAAACVL